MSERNKELCHQCDECCRYVAVEIDRPKTKTDYDHLIWQLLHDNVNVYVDWENDWYVEFITPCSALDKKTKLCRIYNNRPKICRDFHQNDCLKYNHDPVEKFYFKTADDLKKYLKKRKINYQFKFKK